MIDLKAFEQELAGAPLTSPYAFDLAIAILSDCFRLARLGPPQRSWWDEVAARHPAGRVEEQVGMMAHILASTRLRQETGEQLTLSKPDAEQIRVGLGQFFEEIEPVTGEMIRSNLFRREESVRRWLSHWAPKGEATVVGEAPEDSAKRLAQLDYRVAVQEYERAEKDRDKDKAARAKLLKEAADREAAARGWRE